MDRLTKKEIKELRKIERQEIERKEARQKRLKNYAFWGGFTILLLLCIGVIYLVTRPAPSKVLSESVTTTLPQVNANDNSSGPQNAKVTLIEYGDYQCPACGHFYPMVARLKDEYKDTLRFIYRDFPIPTIHKNAVLASQAAYAAKKQGKFWEMYDLLFKNQNTWGESDTADEYFTQYATQLKLDSTQFTTDMMSEDATKTVTAAAQGGEKAGVKGTPTFFLNGKLLLDPVTYEDFKDAVEQELRNK